MHAEEKVVCSRWLLLRIRVVLLSVLAANFKCVKNSSYNFENANNFWNFDLSVSRSGNISANCKYYNITHEVTIFDAKLTLMPNPWATILLEFGPALGKVDFLR